MLSVLRGVWRGHTPEPPVPHFSHLGAGRPQVHRGAGPRLLGKGAAGGLSWSLPVMLSSNLLPCVFFVLFLGISVKFGRLTHRTAFSCVAFIVVAV